MIAQIVLKQIAGGSLKFQPNSTLGFTKGANYALLSISQYSQGSIYANIGFKESQPATFDSATYTVGATLPINDAPTAGHATVDDALAAAAVAAVISYLKGFNSTSDFEVGELAADPA
jgi:hypothetical protein